MLLAGEVADERGQLLPREAEPDVERMVAEYDSRRRLLVDGLNALGIGYGVDIAGASHLLGQCVEYDIGNVFDPA